MNRKDSGAFIEEFVLEPTAAGMLDGLTFAVKDLIDVAGHITGCGNPWWRDTHPPAIFHAVCVEQLLAAGARCAGKTVTDELAYSLLGENYFYGTPLNPKAPDRVPGGSSSGSASAVACELVDFAIGTDTGGSVRVPAANCGIWGFRPTHGRISVAGVSPLSPTFDTVGVFARSVDIVARVSCALLSNYLPDDRPPANIHLIREAFDSADANVRSALQEPVGRLRSMFPNAVRETSLREINGEPSIQDLHNWYEIYRVLQRAEAASTLGAWVESTRPQFGPLIAESFDLMKTLDRRSIPVMLERREEFYNSVKAFLSEYDFFCIPTAYSPAPIKGSVRTREQGAAEYYPKTLSLTAIAGVARAPQISMPLADVSGVPVGLSLIARTGADMQLLSLAAEINRGWTRNLADTRS